MYVVCYTTVLIILCVCTRTGTEDTPPHHQGVPDTKLPVKIKKNKLKLKSGSFRKSHVAPNKPYAKASPQS